MQRVIIDTDTASDDAVAIILALREPSVKVEAITVVAGNVPLELAVKNALISVEMAHTYRPPVYRGMVKPLLRPLCTAECIHGDDGLGNMNLPDASIALEDGHAVDVLIRLVEENPGELELITLGPLTNVAMACLKAPDTMRKLKRITIMGGAGLGVGNMTPVAEFNIYVDAEAASIVFQSGVPILLVGWDVSLGDAFITEAELQSLVASGSPIAEFCVRCNRTLLEFNLMREEVRGIDLPDPVTVAAALYPEIVLEAFDAYTYVDYKSELSYGQVLIDSLNLLGREPNIKICKTIDGPAFKKHLFDRITS